MEDLTNKAMDSLTIYDLACILGNPVMTDQGVGVLDRVKTTGHHCSVSFDTNYQKLYYAHEILPILKPTSELVGSLLERYKVDSVTTDMYCLRNGYDVWDWIGKGQAINESEITKKLGEL